jgi:hypothetical protein
LIILITFMVVVNPDLEVRSSVMVQSCIVHSLLDLWIRMQQLVEGEIQNQQL